jgi:hypothetical protein
MQAKILKDLTYAALCSRAGHGHSIPRSQLDNIFCDYYHFLLRK